MACGLQRLVDVSLPRQTDGVRYRANTCSQRPRRLTRGGSLPGKYRQPMGSGFVWWTALALPFREGWLTAQPFRQAGAHGGGCPLRASHARRPAASYRLKFRRLGIADASARANANSRRSPVALGLCRGESISPATLGQTALDLSVPRSLAVVAGCVWGLAGGPRPGTRPRRNT